MEKMILTTRKVVCLFFSLLLIAPAVQAQFLRTSYFMEGSTHRLQLNPALQPTRGYVNLPVIGMFNASVSSNTLGAQDVIDVIGSGDDFYNNDKFMNKLKGDNTLNSSINTDVISFGFFKGKGFWSFNIGLRTDIHASIPKSMFEYMRFIDSKENWNNRDIDIQSQRVRVNSYTEIGLGYSRSINDRLTVGTKLKLLGGAANMDMHIQNINMYANESTQSADISVKAQIEGSFKGLEMVKNSNGYVDDLEIGNFGVAGYGGAIDLGATYKVLDNLTVSAAVLDLGFISWSKDSYQFASANVDDHYNASNYHEFEERTNGGDVLDFDLLRMETAENVEKKSRSTNLASTLVLGGEYAIMNNKLAFGALSTTRFLSDETMSEITLSANYRPKSWLNATLSYSMIQSAGKSFGAAVKLGPLMVGTDYIFFGNNSTCANAYIGFSIPLGAKK